MVSTTSIRSHLITPLLFQIRQWAINGMWDMRNLEFVMIWFLETSQPPGVTIKLRSSGYDYMDLQNVNGGGASAPSTGMLNSDMVLEGELQSHIWTFQPSVRHRTAFPCMEFCLPDRALTNLPSHGSV